MDNFKESNTTEMFGRKKENNIKQGIIIIGILLSFVVIYIIDFLQRSTMIQYDFNSRINNIIKGIICIMIIMIIPFERINYMIKSGIINKNIFEMNLKRNRLIAILALYTVPALLGFGIYSNFYYAFSYYGYYFSVFMFFIVLFIIIYSSDWIEGGFAFLNFNLFVATVNGLLIYYVTKSFYVGLLFSVATILTFCISISLSDKKRKIFSVIYCVMTSILIFFIIVILTGKTKQFKAWLNLDTDYVSQEQLILRNHTLHIEGGLTYEFYLRHPFVTMYTKLGIVSVVICVGAFLLLMGLVIYSKKVLSGKRYIAMLGVYFLFAVIFISVLLADLGFVPTTSMTLVTSTFFIESGIMIRTLVRKKI